MPHSQVSSIASDALTVSTRASSVNAFHRPIRNTTAFFPEKQSEPLSPALEGFSFADPEPTKEQSVPPVVGISFDFEDKPRSNGFGDINSDTKTTRGMSQQESRQETNRRRTQYYEDSLAYKEGHGQSGKEGIQRDSPVIAELRTNVIIKDEYTVVTNLSQHLSERYHRPESSIMITITHSACLMLGGSFEPAYILSISAIPSEVQPVTNKRNCYLMQHFIADIIHVPSSRGVVRFIEIPEERLATNGSTIAGDIERLEINAGGQVVNKNSRKSLVGNRRKSLLNGGKKPGSDDELERKNSTKSTKSMKSLKSTRSVKEPAKGKVSPPVPLQQPNAEFRNSVVANGSPRNQSPARSSRVDPDTTNINGTGTASDMSKPGNASQLKSPSRPTTANRPASSRKHLTNITGNQQDIPVPPPVPEDDPVPKVSRRKSLIAMFSRKDQSHKS